MYKTLVMPYFNYCSAVWVNINKGLADKFQKNQNRAAGILTFSTYEVCSIVLLDELGWERLEYVRLKQLALTMYKIYAGKGCQLAESRLKLYWQAKLRSIDSCRNGTCADHYQETNNVGSGSLRYTIWHFPLYAGRICLTHTRSLLIRIFAILMKVN